jgi:hypothetical protein
MIYECYSQSNSFDNDQIRDAFSSLYNRMNGKSLREMDEIIHPVCTLCREHERSGFIDGIKIGVLLCKELQQPINYEEDCI